MRILDCTLRDGGYVNNWKFSRECFDGIVSGGQRLGIDAIEVGILGKEEDESHFSTKFSNLGHVPRIDVSCGTDIAVMGTMTEFEELSTGRIPQKEDVDITVIRVAFFKQDYREAIALCYMLQEKGYRVFLQAMATFLYSREELDNLLEEVARVSPYAFYLVDSFGTMYPEDVERMYGSIREKLDLSIHVGFHAHNNIQLAFANAIQFIEIAEDNDYLDASFLGMGRGAGNLNMELLLRYLNEKKNQHYDIEYCMELIEKDLQGEYRKYRWGYAVPYFYTSLYGANSAYVWYLERNGIQDNKTVGEILKGIPEKWRYTLNRNIVDRLIREYGD